MAFQTIAHADWTTLQEGETLIVFLPNEYHPRTVVVDQYNPAYSDASPFWTTTDGHSLYPSTEMYRYIGPVDTPTQT